MSNSGVAFLSAPATPGYSMYDRIARWLATGSLTPTFGTAPAFRAGTGSTSAHSTGTSQAITLSPSIVVDDLIIVQVVTGWTGYYITPPSGWSQMPISPHYNSPYAQEIFYKFATAGDIGATVTFSTPSGGQYWSLTSASYSGVWKASPFNPGGQGFGNYNGASQNSFVAPAVTTTVANTLIVQVLAINSDGAGITMPSTMRSSDSGGVISSGISDQSQAVAGTTSAQTASCTNNASGCIIQIVLQGIPTVVAAPSGSWECIDSYGPIGNPDPGMSFVWQTSANNSGVTWYLIFTTAPPGTNGTTTGFQITACETYSTSTRQWNACVIDDGGYTPPFTSISGSSPPWAQIASSPHTVDSLYGSQKTVVPQVAVGTTNFMVAANADGFFFTSYTTTETSCMYVGAFTSLIVNPALTASEGGIVLCDLAAGGVGSTRDPGAVSAGSYCSWGHYQTGPFWPNGLQFQGTINGSNNYNDQYQAANGTPIAARVAFYKNGGSPYNQGSLRGLLPTWVQKIPQTSCVWGDTVTEGSDTLTYIQGNGANWWIDTTAA